MQSDKSKDKSKGIGDTIEKITKKTGIHWFVKRFVGDCGCDDRRDWLNKRFPYQVDLTPLQVERLEQLFDRERLNFNGAETAELYALNNEIFSEKKKPKSCGPCAKDVTKRLLGIYEKYQENLQG